MSKSKIVWLAVLLGLCLTCCICSGILGLFVSPESIERRQADREQRQRELVERRAADKANADQRKAAAATKAAEDKVRRNRARAEAAEERANKKFEAELAANNKKLLDEIEKAAADRERKAKQDAREAQAKRESDAKRLKDRKHGTALRAKEVADDFMSQYLKVQRREFALSAKQTKELSKGVWFVLSHVDTSDDLGRDIRLYYAAEVKCVGDDKWQLRKLDAWEKDQTRRTLK